MSYAGKNASIESNTCIVGVDGGIFEGEYVGGGSWDEVLTGSLKCDTYNEEDYLIILESHYGKHNDYPQSTTGNISGIFDMEGGLSEYVMANYNNQPVGADFIEPENCDYDTYGEAFCSEDLAIFENGMPQKKFIGLTSKSEIESELK